MLTFKTITAKNFLSIGNDGLTIDLDNKQSSLYTGMNGAGKSSAITDTLTYALYGKPYRDINKPQLVNSINKSNMLVEVVFTTNGKTYKVRRGMKPNIFEIFINDKLLEQDASGRDYQDILETTILKINYKAFTKIVILGKATYEPFMKLKTGARREFIEDLLDLQLFTVMHKLHKDQVDEYKKRTHELNIRIETQQDKIKFIRENIVKMLRNSQEQVDFKQEQLKDYVAQCKSQVELSKELKNNLENLLKEYELKYSLVKDHSIKVKQLQLKIKDKQKTLIKEVEFFAHTNTCSICAQDITSEYKALMVSKRNTTLTELDKALLQVDIKINSIEKQLEEAIQKKVLITNIQTEFLTVKSSINHYKTTITNLQDEIKKLKTQNIESTNNDEVVINLETNLKEYQKEKQSIHDQQNMLRIAGHLLKDTGIKSHFVKKYIPILNASIVHYLNVMNFPFSFKLDENFNEVIDSKDMEIFTYNSFSEGEKFRIDLALIIAFRNIAKKRNSCNCNLIIFDEILDGSLDSEGIESLVELIEQLTAEKTTVYIISHRENVNDVFDNTFKFEKVNKFTQVTQL